MKLVFEFKDYKRYISASLDLAGSGSRSRLAKHLSCQSAHISQVLNGHQQITVEQAYQMNSFFAHDRDESHFFLLLVQKNRAGSNDLKDYFQNQLDEILRRRSLIKNRVSSNKEIPREFQTRYYSSWHYAAIHIALSIPELQTKESLASHFHLPMRIISETLEFLITAQLADRRDGRFVIGPSHIHLGSDTDNINKHHMNWRIQAMDSLARGNERDLHYSVAFSLSRHDADRIKDRFIETVNSNLKDVGPSKEEVIYCTCIDFFEVLK